MKDINMPFLWAIILILIIIVILLPVREGNHWIPLITSLVSPSSPHLTDYYTCGIFASCPDYMQKEFIGGQCVRCILNQSQLPLYFPKCNCTCEGGK